MHLDERFWSKVSQTNPSDTCMLWTAAVNDSGYGVFSVKDDTRKSGYRSEYAHRLSFFAHGGSLQDGETVEHLCKVTACVNPDHLVALDSSENSKGRRNKKLVCDKCGGGRVLRPNGTSYRCPPCDKEYHRIRRELTRA